MTEQAARHYGVLSEAECRSVLRSTPAGQTSHTSGALPTLLPITFAVADDDIVFRTAPGSTLETPPKNTVVAFEIDQIATTTRSRRSVLVIGRTKHITNPQTTSRLELLGQQPWTPDARLHYVRIRCDQIYGRLLG